MVPCHSAPGGRCTCGKSPCGTGNKTAGKHPRTLRGHQEASTDERQIQTWAQKYPGCNWGVATGRDSRLFVVDVDGERGRASLAAVEAQRGPIPNTLTSRTGRADGGEHRYFSYPEGATIRSSSGTLGDGLDVRGDGGLVIIPPSVHASGRTYDWTDPDATIAEAPSWLLGMLTPPRPLHPASNISDSVGRAHYARTGGDADDIIFKGRRNTTLSSIAGKLRQEGKGQEQIRVELTLINLARCEVPLADSEVEKIARSISRYSVRQLPRWWWFQFDMNTWAQSLAVRSGKDYHRGWAVELLYEAARHCGILRDDSDLLYQIARPSCSRKKFDTEVKAVLCDYRRATLDGQQVLIHPGLARWCEERMQTSARRAEAGRKGGKARQRDVEFPSRAAIG